MKFYDVVFVGASLSACAAACRLSRNGCRTLILEPGILTAPEYTAAFQAAQSSTEPMEPETKLFCEELKKRNILQEDRLCCPAVHPAVCRELKKAGADCLFRARIQHVKKGKDGILLSILSLGTHLQVQAASLCDATVKSRFLCTLLGRPLPPGKKTLGCVTAKGDRTQIRYRSFPVPDSLREEDIVSWLFHNWKSYFPQGEEQLCYPAGRFAETEDASRAAELCGYRVMPPAYTLQQAFDTGIQFAKRMEKAHGIL